MLLHLTCRCWDHSKSAHTAKASSMSGFCPPSSSRFYLLGRPYSWSFCFLHSRTLFLINFVLPCSLPIAVVRHIQWSSSQGRINRTFVSCSTAASAITITERLERSCVCTLLDTRCSRLLPGSTSLEGAGSIRVNVESTLCQRAVVVAPIQLWNYMSALFLQVRDRSVIKTTWDETKVTEPAALQHAIDVLVSVIPGARSFVR